MCLFNRYAQEPAKVPLPEELGIGVGMGRGSYRCYIHSSIDWFNNFLEEDFNELHKTQKTRRTTTTTTTDGCRPVGTGHAAGRLDVA